MRTLLTLLEYLGVIMASIVVGWFTINPLCVALGRKYFPDKEWDRLLPRIVGAIEQFIYTWAFLLDAQEFIAVWLALKLAGEWRQSDRRKSYPMYNIFLIGNGLSLILSITTALIIKHLLPPLAL